MSSTEHYVALLRGINVGRAKRVAMADLRALVAGLGYSDVRTLLNSGNVVFSGARDAPEQTARRIERALKERTGVQATVLVLPGAAVHAIVASNPFPEAAAEPARYLVAFLRSPELGRQSLAAVARTDWSPERFALGACAAYLWCAAGISESKLLEAVTQALGDAVTTRNWATVGKLAALV